MATDKEIISSIVGKQAAANMAKAGIKSLAQVRITAPTELMKIAGIGPEKAQDLYQKVGVRFSQNNLERLYHSLANRRLFRQVATVEGRESLVSDLENTKAKIRDIQNNLAKIYNMGRPADKRIPEMSVGPVSLTLSGTAWTTQEKVHGYFAEYNVEREDNKFKIKYIVTGMDTGEVLITQKDEFIYLQDMKRDIVTKHKDVKRKDPEAFFYIVMDKTTRGLLSIKDSHEFIEKELPELNNDDFTNVVSAEDFLSEGWIKTKYQENTVIRDYIEKFEGFKLFEDYEIYRAQLSVANKSPMTFLEYEAQNKTFEVSDWFRKQDLYLASRTYALKFGILKGIPGVENYQSFYRQRDVFDLPVVILPRTWDDFLKLKSRSSGKVVDKEVSLVAFAWMRHVLGNNFKIFYRDALSPVIFRSTKFPEFGVVIG